MRKRYSILMLALLAANSEPAKSPPPGEGVMCAFAIYSVVAEAGRRCFAGQNSDFQSDLGRAVSRIDDYMLKNSKLTREDLERLRKQQFGGSNVAGFCATDATAMYKLFEMQGGKALHSQLDELLARPGEPTWGTCL